MWGGGASNFTYTFLSSDGITNYLIEGAIVNREDCCFKYQDWSWDEKVIIGQNEDSSFLLKRSCWILNLEEFNPVVTRMILVSVRNYKTCHIPLKCWCPIKKSPHIRPTRLKRNVVHFLSRPLQLPNVQIATRNFRWATMLFEVYR